ncbi:MAG: phosphoglycolate phosphatase [Rubrivivax sp.]|nr:phosphoglycolate phosphatase [Rubrivivax sp.]
MNAPAQFQGRPVQALLFDLDGTLMDTAGDIALALQRSMADQGLSAPTPQAVRTMIGRGAPSLVQRACAAQAIEADDALRAVLLQGFFDHYGRLQDEGAYDAQPYPGALEAVAAVHAAGLPLALVTNKQRRFAQALLRLRGLEPAFRVVCGGDTCERRKPDPQPLLWAAAQLGVPPAQTLMVGDSVNDVTAARAAGMPVLCMTYGYNEGRDVKTLPADAFADSMTELPRLLGLAGFVQGQR